MQAVEAVTRRECPAASARCAVPLSRETTLWTVTNRGARCGTCAWGYRELVVFGGSWRGGGRFPRRGPVGGDPFGDPYGGGRYRGYPRRGDGLGRDACLLEGGCCLGEALNGNCLLLTLAVLPQLAGAVLHGGASPERADGRRRSSRRLIAAIGVYQQQISPHLAGGCRFDPSCSQYAVQALARHGSARGSWLALRRLTRCRPSGPRGNDPVPAPR